MKKYVFTGVVCLSLVVVSCAQKAPESYSPSVPVYQQEDPPITPDHQERILPSQLPTIADPMFLTGTTTYQSKFDADRWFGKPVEKPDLGTIANNGAIPLMIAFGGGLTGGVSNGGLNREAQQFAYPNLVARQMGILDFKTPLLSENEANGTGDFSLRRAQCRFSALVGSDQQSRCDGTRRASENDTFPRSDSQFCLL